MTDIIKEIVKEQEKLGLSDAEFSRLLDIDQSEWSRVKRGLRFPTLGFFRVVAQKIPSLQLAIMNYIASPKKLKERRLV